MTWGKDREGRWILYQRSLEEHWCSFFFLPPPPPIFTELGPASQRRRNRTPRAGMGVKIELNCPGVWPAGHVFHCEMSSRSFASCSVAVQHNWWQVRLQLFTQLLNYLICPVEQIMKGKKTTSLQFDIFEIQAIKTAVFTIQIFTFLTLSLITYKQLKLFGL